MLGLGAWGGGLGFGRRRGWRGRWGGVCMRCCCLDWRRRDRNVQRLGGRIRIFRLGWLGILCGRRGRC